jgi:multiple sugar transport system substrate-binding protein
MSSMLRRKVALFTILIFILGILAGCSTSTEPANAPGNESPGTSTPAQSPSDSESEDEIAVSPDWDKNPIELTYWHTYAADSAERSKFNDVVIPMWNELHPNVKINAIAQDGGDTYHENTMIAMNTGATPDAARIDIIYTAAYADLGALVRLDTFSDFEALKATLLEAPLNTNFYNGGYYGLPLDTNCKAAVVNTEVMKAMGIEDGIPDTMEELIALSDEYIATSGKAVMPVTGIGDWDFYPYFWLFGGVVTNEDYTKASGYLDSPESVNAINTIKDLNRRKIITCEEIDGTPDAWSRMTDGTYGLLFEGPWYWGGYDENNNPITVPALIPSYNGKTTTVVGGQDIVVFSTSQYQEAAYEFAKFVCSEDVQKVMLEAGVFPTVKTVAESEAILSHPVWSVYMEQIKHANVRIPSPNNSAIVEAWKTAMNTIFLDGKDVQTTLTEAAAKIDDLLAD